MYNDKLSPLKRLLPGWDGLPRTRFSLAQKDRCQMGLCLSSIHLVKRPNPMGIYGCQWVQLCQAPGLELCMCRKVCVLFGWPRQCVVNIKNSCSNWESSLTWTKDICFKKIQQRENNVLFFCWMVSCQLSEVKTYIGSKISWNVFRKKIIGY